MSRNGSGTYALYPGVNPVVTGTTITSAWANNTLSDIATALTASIANDGQTPILANLPMFTFRHTGVGNAVARTDYAAAGQVQDSIFLWGGTAGGTADVLTITLSPAITAYSTGQAFEFIVGASPNATTTPTLNVNGVGAKTIVRKNGAACAAGDLAAGMRIRALYDGTNFRLDSPAVNVASGKTFTVSNTLTATGTDGSTLNFGSGGTVAYTANKLSSFAATTSAELASVISDETGSGALVFANAPTLSDVVVSSSSSADAMRITQTGSGNALVVEDSTNPDSTPFVVDANGNVAVGNSTAFRPLSVYATGETSNFDRYSADAFGAYTRIRKSRASAINTQAVVSNGDNIGGFLLQASDGTSFITAAEIKAEVDGTPGTNDMPGRLVFSVTADGASTPTEALRISNTKAATFAGSITVSGSSAALPATTTVGGTQVAAFGTIAVSGQSNVVADSVNDTLTLAAGAGVTLTTDASTDTVTIAATGSSGGLVYLSTVTASNSSTVDIETTIDSTYDAYMIVYSGVVPNTDGVDMYSRFKIGGSYVTSAVYYYRTDYSGAGADSTVSTTGTNAISFMNIVHLIGNAAGKSASGVIYLHNPASTTLTKMMHFTGVHRNAASGESFIQQSNGIAGIDNTGAVTGVRFYMSTGNIASGTFRLYGIKNS